jgi:hypothetical protein
MFPIIPLIGWALAALGGGTLWWYYALGEAEQLRADRLAAEYAAKLFDKAVNQLTVGEARQVHDLVRRHFDN